MGLIVVLPTGPDGHQKEIPVPRFMVLPRLLTKESQITPLPLFLRRSLAI